MVASKKSKIHGHGVFALEKIARGRIIPVPNSRNFRGFNRSCTPNAIIEYSNVYAVRTIEPGEEITLGYILRDRNSLRRRKCGCEACKK